MELLINGRCMEGKITGVGRYLVNILNVWTEKYRKHKYKILFKNEIPVITSLSKECVYSSIAPRHEFINHGPIWENVYLPLAARKHKYADLYFSPYYTLPLVGMNCKKVVTIFDISYLTHPEWFPYKQRMPFELLTKSTLKQADMILTGTEYTKHEILGRYNVSPEKIKVTNLGVDDKFIAMEREIQEFDGVKTKYKLSQKTVLFVGTIFNRRNVPVLMEAVANLIKRSGEDISLVIVGQNSTYPYFDVEQMAQKYNMLEHLRWIPYTTDKELFSLYKVADVFVCSSLYEGFNIPPLEAMYLGVPVICSVLTSLPEVVGDAAFPLKDPTNFQEMTMAIEKVLSDDNLKTNLIKKGRERSKLFSWDKCGTETMECFEKLVEF